METNFQLAMKQIATWEWGNKADGGYTNNPTDPGGETKFGISKRAHPNEDIKNLTLQRAFEIYQDEYWKHYSIDKLPLPYCIAVMDSYVQHRPSAVQRMLDTAKGDWKRLITARRDFYGRLVMQNPSQQMFLKGWTNRLNDLSKYCGTLENVTT